MPSNYTENFNLSQWEKSDKVLMDDFNADNAKLDAALAELQTGALRLHVGHYRGTGTQTNTIQLPFKPRFFYLQKATNEDVRLMIFEEKTVMVRQWAGEPTGMFNGQGAIITIGEAFIHLKALDSLDNNEKMLCAMNVTGCDYYYIALA